MTQRERHKENKLPFPIEVICKKAKKKDFVKLLLSINHYMLLS